MAIRKKQNEKPEPKKKSGFIGKLKTIRNIVLFVLAFIMGMIVSNLDRCDQLGILLLRCKTMVPYPLSKFLPGASAEVGAPVPEQLLEGRVIEVYDGDTATLFDERANKKYKVRFFGIDAPEKNMHFGTDSRDALREKILGKNVSVRVSGVDLYQRALGRVMLGARYINLEMVSEGWAWYYPDYAANEYDLAAAEREARVLKRGLWQENNPLPPWEFRKK